MFISKFQLREVYDRIHKLEDEIKRLTCDHPWEKQNFYTTPYCPPDIYSRTCLECNKSWIYVTQKEKDEMELEYIWKEEEELKKRKEKIADYTGAKDDYDKNL